jgi:hypothetical protein
MFPGSAESIADIPRMLRLGAEPASSRSCVRIDHPTFKLTPAEKLVLCAELTVMLHDAEGVQGAREAQSATKH